MVAVVWVYYFTSYCNLSGLSDHRHVVVMTEQCSVVRLEKNHATCAKILVLQ